MILHKINYTQKTNSYTWIIGLRFRLVKGDEIHIELLLKHGSLINNKQLDEKFHDLLPPEMSLTVDTIEIDEKAYVVAFLKETK